MQISFMILLDRFTSNIVTQFYGTAVAPSSGLTWFESKNTSVGWNLTKSRRSLLNFDIIQGPRSNGQAVLCICLFTVFNRYYIDSIRISVTNKK